MTKRQPTKNSKTLEREALLDWEKLEIVIANIQQSLAPEARVEHNRKIRGKSGTIRKLDISISGKIGINPILIDIDAKHRGRAISRTAVAGFAEQVDDIGPCLGIMISDFKFGRGAKQVANKHNIILKTFTEATETDWEQLFGLEPCAFITLGNWTVHKAWMPSSIVGGVVSHSLIELHPGTRLFTQQGEDYALHQGSPCVLGDLFSHCYQKLPRPKPIGRFRTRINQLTPLFYIQLVNEGKFICPPYILIDGSMYHKKYPITYQIAKGRSLKSIDLDNVEAMKVITDEIDLTELRNSQQGVLLTEEEWKEHERLPFAEYHTDENHLYSIEFIATPKEPK